MSNVKEQLTSRTSNLRSRLDGVDLRQNAIFIALLALIGFFALICFIAIRGTDTPSPCTTYTCPAPSRPQWVNGTCVCAAVENVP